MYGIQAISLYKPGMHALFAECISVCISAKQISYTSRLRIQVVCNSLVPLEPGYEANFAIVVHMIIENSIESSANAECWPALYNQGKVPRP